MTNFQMALRSHPDYEAYCLGYLDLVIIDNDSYDFLFVPSESIDASDLEEGCDCGCCGDVNDWVDESNYDPYSGCDVFESCEDY